MKNLNNNRIIIMIRFLIAFVIICWAVYPDVRVVHTFLPYPHSGCNCNDPFVGTSRIDKKPDIAKPHTSPISFQAYGTNLILNTGENKNAFIYIDTSLSVRVDSPEYAMNFSERLDSLRNQGVPISYMQIRPEFMTNYNSHSLKEIKEITIENPNGKGSIVVSPESLFITFNRPSEIDSKNISINSPNIQMAIKKIVNSNLNLLSDNVSFRGQLTTSRFNSTAFTSYIDRCNIDSSQFSFTRGSALFESCNIISNSQVEFTDSISLSNIEGKGILGISSNKRLNEYQKKTIDTFIRMYGDDRGIEDVMRPSKMTLSNVDISKIDFDPNQILVCIDTSEKNTLANSMFSQLIEKFKNNESQRRIYDVAYHKYTARKKNSWWYYFKDLVEENWDYYGYEPQRIFHIIGHALLLFYAINLAFYPWLLKKGYNVVDFECVYEKTAFFNLPFRLLSEVFYSFLYTVLLFWIFKLDLSKLKVSNPLAISWILIQHIISLLLLTFAVRAILL